MHNLIISFIALFFTVQTFAEPAVWEAKKGDLRFVLMGSVHMGKASFYPLPDAITATFPESQGLIVEANLFDDTDFTVPPGQASDTFLNGKEQEALKSIAEQVQLPWLAVKNMPPWQAAITIQQAQTAQLGFEPQLGIDVHFLSQANENQVPIIALETLAQQIGFIASMRDDGLPLLLDTMDYWEESKEAVPCMMAAWEVGDSEIMTEMVEEMLTESSGLEEIILTDRNHRWADELTGERYKDKGLYTVVVGALHLYGEEGLLSLLQNEGFVLTRLTEEGNAGCELPARR